MRKAATECLPFPVQRPCDEQVAGSQADTPPWPKAGHCCQPASQKPGRILILCAVFRGGSWVGGGVRGMVWGEGSPWSNGLTCRSVRRLTGKHRGSWGRETPWEI